MLTNTSSGKHDFSAPAFFAAASFRVDGSVGAARGAPLAGRGGGDPNRMKHAWL
jgi:hypothetical protein